MKNNFIKFITISGVLMLFSSTVVFSQEAKIPCLKKNGGVGLNGLEKFDCALISQTVNNPTIKDNYKRKVNQNLSEKLYIQMHQKLEELSTLDSYFSASGRDLGNNDDAVLGSCRLDIIAKPSCIDSKKDDKEFKEKYKMLLNRFQNSPVFGRYQKQPHTSDSLVTQLKYVSKAIRGIEPDDQKTCPAVDQTGMFTVESQFSEAAAKGYIQTLVVNKIDSSAFYRKYPQLQMLYQAKDKSPEGARVVENFENELKKYNEAKDGSAKAYFENLFFSKNIQDQLASVLASSCKMLKNNLNDFLCGDVKNLGLPRDQMSDFFNDDESEIDIATAKGFSCKYDNDNGDENVNLLTGKDSISDLNERFSQQTRKKVKAIDMERFVGPFCAEFECKDDRVKTMPSCKNGGPLNSKDLLNLCMGRDVLKCDEFTQKYVYYLQSLEKDKEVISSNRVASDDISPSGEVQKPKGYSSFYQNFMGIDGTLMAEGKKITPQTIEAKKEEFVERKIEVPANTATLTQQSKKEEQRQENVGNNGYNPAPRTQDVSGNNFALDSSRNQSEAAKKPILPPKFGQDGASTKAKKADYGYDEDAGRLDEMKKLRAELAEAVAKVKGTDEEKLAAIDANNRTVVSPKTAAAVTAEMSSAEKQRLDMYRDSLNSWESRLRTWQGQLSDRDYSRGPSSSSNNNSNTPGAAAQSGSIDMGRGSFNSESGSSSGGSGANGLKLTKSGGAANGKDAKGESGAERGAGSEGTEPGDAGVVNSETLPTLQKESLTKLGIATKDSFIIKVRYQDVIYPIPVKTLTYKGKSMWVPMLSEKNKELAAIVLQSPIFSEYRNYQAESKLGKGILGQ